MKHLPVGLNCWEFVAREKGADNTPVIFRCGRDFLYYALHYYETQTYNLQNGGPKAIEAAMFGRTVPTSLLFTAWHLKKIPHLLTQHNLLLRINQQPVRTWWQLVRQLYRTSSISSQQLEQAVAAAISRGTVIGIDFSIKWLGLVDHVLFVYGYDDEYYYVFDTLQLADLSYQKIAEDSETFYMKLPKSVVYERLRPISRIWTVEPDTTV